MTSAPKPGAGYAGLVEMRKCRVTKDYIGVYRSAEAGLEADPDLPWSTVCESHSYIVSHSTLANARAAASYPDWCEECSAKMNTKETP